MNIKQPYRLPELKEKISSGEYGAELMLQHAMLIIDEYRNQCITDTARIATLESQLRVITKDRDRWVEYFNERFDCSSELTIEEYKAKRIAESARIATLESQIRAMTDDRDGWVKQCSDRIDDALAFAKESDDRASEINLLKEIRNDHRNVAIEIVAKLLRVHENMSKPESREIAKSIFC